MKPRTFVVLAIVGLMVVGCTWTGGGWMPGANGGKATIGFNGVCEDGGQGGGFTTTSQDGNSMTFSYVDKSVSPAVNIKGTAVEPTCQSGPYFQTEDSTAPCYNTACDSTTFYGEYRPAKGDGGDFEMRFVDSGTQGPSKGDLLRIELYGGKNGGYVNDQVLGGGNYKVRADED